MKFVTSLAPPGIRYALLSRFDKILRSGMYAEGPETAQAEERLTQYLEAPSLTLNSCGSALLAAFRYYKQAGATAVLMQNNTFWATASMAREAGLHVVLVDSCPDCPSMSASSLAEALDKLNLVGGVIVCLTHIGGWIAKDYQRIVQLCKDEKIPLVEDCAHLFGNPAYMPDPYATQCWSFYPTKAVPVGDAGALSTHDASLYQYVERFRKYGKYLQNGQMMYGPGQNLRISEFNAAILDLQIERVAEIVDNRSACAAALQSIAECALSGPSNYYKYPVWKSDVQGLKTTSSVYSPTDLVLYTMPEATAQVSLVNSIEWSGAHACLPVGEHLYQDLSVDQLRQTLEVA